ncbi:MAG: hypothetical protein M3P33_00445 [bacterium]|nr:hypothetical protein [bacterium]
MDEVATKADISRLENEVLSLKSLFQRFVAISGSKVSSQKNTRIDMNEPSGEEMMKHAESVFEVTSEYSDDDDNIDVSKLKPIIRSEYV